MSTPTIGEERLALHGGAAAPDSRLAAPRLRRAKLVAAAEAMAMFAACQLFLWEYSQRYRRFWLALLVFMIGSVLLRRETSIRLGLRPLQGLASLRWVALGVAAGAGPLLLYGWRHGRIGLGWPDGLALLQFAGYAVWCLLQQFALQSYMHNRLLDSVRSPRVSSLMTAVIFGSLHLPNPVLTIATLAGGWAMGELFTRYRNIWILALGQALVSTAILVSLPDSMHHRLRVGPGFDRWQGQ